MTKKFEFKKLIPWIAVALVAVGLALLPVITKNDKEDEDKATIKNSKAEIRDIDTVLLGGGQIESSGVLDVEIPENVKIKEFVVSNGDTVKEGDPIAVIDNVSAKEAILKITETMDELDDEIADASTSSSTTYIKSVPSGTVKKVYAQVGDDINDVTVEYGCLAVISLDDTMGVTTTVDTDMMPGDKVNVQIGDATVTGRVKTNAGGQLKVMVDDNKYEIDSVASVYSTDGVFLGSGKLYVYNPWNVTAYSGTISSVHIKEGQSVYEGSTLFTVKETGKSYDYQKAVDKRQKYEKMLKELYQVYSLGYVPAPCDGIVSGIDTSGEFLLSYNPEAEQNTQGYKVVLLSDAGNTQPTENAGDSGNQGNNAASENKIETATVIGPTQINGTQGVFLQASYYATDTSTILTGSGTYSCTGTLPVGLSFDSSTGALYGIPTASTESGDVTVTISFTPTSGGLTVNSLPVVIHIEKSVSPILYFGHIAVVEKANQGSITVKRSGTEYPIADPNNLPSVVPQSSEMTIEDVVPTSPGAKYSTGDVIWIIYENSSGKFHKTTLVSSTSSGGGGGGGGGGTGGKTGGGGGMSGGMTMEEDDGLYSLDKITIANVTSQEEMTVSISIDELDITKVYVGQKASITMNAFAQEPVEAVVTNISNSGENSGGNSKFTVKLKLNKSSEMLPGMNATATMTLDSAKDVLTVPAASVYTLADQKVVYTSYNTRDELLENPVVVTTGSADAEHVQILSGLNENDTVYYEVYETIGTTGVNNAI